MRGWNEFALLRGLAKRLSRLMLGFGWISSSLNSLTCMNLRIKFPKQVIDVGIVKLSCVITTKMIIPVLTN